MFGFNRGFGRGSHGYSSHAAYPGALAASDFQQGIYELGEQSVTYEDLWPTRAFFANELTTPGVVTSGIGWQVTLNPGNSDGMLGSPALNALLITAGIAEFITVVEAEVNSDPASSTTRTTFLAVGVINDDYSKFRSTAMYIDHQDSDVPPYISTTFSQGFANYPPARGTFAKWANAFKANGDEEIAIAGVIPADHTDTGNVNFNHPVTQAFFQCECEPSGAGTQSCTIRKILYYSIDRLPDLAALCA